MEALQSKLSDLYGLPCKYEDGHFVLYGPKGHSLVQIGTIQGELFDVTVADGILTTFYSVEKVVMYNAERLITTLNNYFRMEAKVSCYPFVSFDDMKLLTYYSPSGVELFRVLIRRNNGVWKCDYVTDTLSAQVRKVLQEE